MRRRITEQTILFLSVVKWVVLASAAGMLVGAATAFFLKALAFVTNAVNDTPSFFLTLPVALAASAFLVKYLAPDARGHGTEKVIEALHRRSGKIETRVVPTKLVATLITLGAGGSAGKEGPCAQIGAGLCSLLADMFRFDDQDRKKLVICGVSAGFAAVFGTPIAGSIFGVEVLFVGSILYEVLLPSFIAGITAYQVASSLGITYFYHPFAVVPVFTESFLLIVLFAGVLFGTVSMILIEVLRLGERTADRLTLHPVVKALLGGLVLVILTLIFSTEYLGLGLQTIEASLIGKAVVWYAFLAKTLFTSITLAFGGSGGIITPIFFIGATAGSAFALLTGHNMATFAAIGMVSVLAGAANTPIAASILAVELFGPALAPYATVACVISFLMTGHRSVYPSQIVSVRKSPSILVELGKEIDEIRATPHPRRRSLTATLLRFIKKFEQIGKS